MSNDKPLSKNEQEVKSCLETLLKFLGVESARVEFVDNEFQRKIFEIYTEVIEDRGKIIGKKGQNVRLAAKLSGWKIDVRSPKEAITFDETIEADPTVPTEAVPVKSEV